MTEIEYVFPQLSSAYGEEFTAPIVFQHKPAVGEHVRVVGRVFASKEIVHTFNCPILKIVHTAKGMEITLGIPNDATKTTEAQKAREKEAAK